MSVPLTLLVTLTDGAVRPVAEADAHDLLRARSFEELRRELRECEQRLGTPAERRDDFEWARALAHEINNRATMEYLRAALASGASVARLVA